MNQLINRIFKIWAYTVSHNFLIIRSPMKFPDQDDYNEDSKYNIDIEFSSVAYLDIPTILKGIELQEIIKDDEIPENLLKFKLDSYKIFRLKSEHEFYYIVASNLSIGINKWINQDKIMNFKLKHDEILDI